MHSSQRKPHYNKQYNSNNHHNHQNNNHHNHHQNNNKPANTEKTETIIANLNDYMFTTKNLIRFTKHMITPNMYFKQEKYKQETQNTLKQEKQNSQRQNSQRQNTQRQNTLKQDKYFPKQKDSLFWCFYILKNGYSKYEMEINNQYFTVEKQEKFKYITMLRNKKDILKIHKIKPFTELEDDLANKEKISVKTFFALCILENINVLFVDKRKIMELFTFDVDADHPIHIVHRGSSDHYIELDVTEEMIQKYRDTYYKMESCDAKLKSMGSYKLDELVELCKKLDISIINEKKDKEGKSKKMTKSEIYERLVLHY
jgi:hypothetical protein